MNARCILLVDDNSDDVDLTLRAFRKNKISNKIVVAHDGVEALDYLFGTGIHAGRDTSIQPQVILMDLKMPKLDGLETLRRLRGPSIHNIPVVILTSSKEESDLVASYDRGANSFILKPVDFVQFVETVQHLNLYWIVMNQVAPTRCEQGDSR